MIQPASILSFLLLIQGPALHAETASPGAANQQEQQKNLRDLLEELSPGKRLYVREKALAAIASLGPDAEDAVPALIRTLKNKRLRIPAMNALAAIADRATAAISSLRGYLKSQDPKVRSSAQDSLMAIGFDVVPFIAKDIGSKRFFRQAAAKLATLGERAKPAVRKLVSVIKYYPKEDKRLLQNRTKMERHKARIKEANERRLIALHTLSRMGAAKLGAFAAFKRTIYHRNREIAALAIRCLASCGDAAMAPLLTAIKRKGFAHTDLALIALKSFGPAAKKALPQLEKLSNKATELLAKSALDAYLSVEGTLEIAERLRNGDARQRKAAALQLVGFGDVASSDLLRALRDRDRSIRDAILDEMLNQRRFATETIVEGRPAPAAWPPKPLLSRQPFVPYFIELLEGDDVKAQVTACHILGSMGGKEREAAVDSLLRACSRKDAPLRRAAMHALLDFGLRDSQSVAALGRLMRGQSSAFRLSILGYLAQIGQAAKPACNELIAALSFASSQVSAAASSILVRSRFANELAAALSSTESARRRAAARCLAAFGKRARSKLKTLRAALEAEKDAATRKEIQSAILSIEKDG